MEIKSFPERPRDSVEPVLNVIAKTGSAPRVLISSFDHRDVAAAQMMGREYALGILAMTPLYRTEHYGAKSSGLTLSTCRRTYSGRRRSRIDEIVHLNHSRRAWWRISLEKASRLWFTPSMIMEREAWQKISRPSASPVLFTDNPAEMITAFRKLPPNRAFK